MSDVRASLFPHAFPGSGRRWRHRSWSVVAVAILSLLGALVAAPRAQASDPSPYNQRYENRLSHLCLAPAGGSTDRNATIVQYDCGGGADNIWTAEYNSNVHAYQIRNTRTSNELCLSPAGGGTGLNGLIVQYTCDGDLSRFWTFVPETTQTGLGILEVRNVKSGLCLSPAGGSTGLNAAIVQYSCDGDPSRGWYVFRPGLVQSTNSGNLCLATAGASNTINTAAVSYYCDTAAARRWHFIYPGGASFSMQNVGSTLCLSPAGGGTGLNTVIVQYYCDGNPARSWRLVEVGSVGYGQIQNMATGLCLSPAGGSTGINVAMVQYTCDGAPSRVWHVYGI